MALDATTTQVRTDDGCSLAVHTRGSGAGHVLFVHGWMASSASWQPLAPLLDLRGQTHAFVDLRGAGASATGDVPLTLERLGRDLLCVADALSWSRFSVVGHSMGGQLGQWLACNARDRVEALAAICPVPQSGMQLPEDALGLFQSAGGNARKLRMILSLATKQIADVHLQLLVDEAMAIEPGWLQQGLAAWTAGFAADLSTVRARTVIIGSDDPFLTVEALKEKVVDRVPGARFAYIDGVGHYPQLERPAAVAATLEAFFAGLPAVSAGH